jgi:hypothetical protein
MGTGGSDGGGGTGGCGTSIAGELDGDVEGSSKTVGGLKP